jgi:alanyl-tRNA synthetase
MANHTATHLLHAALRETLGEHVRQAGSAVRPDKLRFDFTHSAQLTAEQREAIEQRVNAKIFENLPVLTFWTTRDEAERLGAMALFGEKYGDDVRVVEVPGFSRELCGGTHVRSTAEIGSFVILSEGSVGSGARRIEAVTSGEAFALLHERAREAEALRAELSAARKEARRKVASSGDDGVEVLREEEHGGVHVVLAEVRDAAADELPDVADRLKARRSPAAVVLGAKDDGRVHLVVALDPSLEGRLDAVEVVRAAAAEVGGGGGGRPTMARAGGRDPERLAEAFEKAWERITAAL